MFKKISDIEEIKRRRWLTLICQVFVGTATSYAYILTVYVEPLHEAYGWGADKILLAFTLSMWVGSPAMIVGGKIRDKYGNKTCIVIGGLLYGVSIVLSGMVTNVYLFVVLQGGIASFLMYIVYMAKLQNLGTLFPDKRGLAIGLVSGATDIASAGLPIMAVYLINTFSVSTSIVFQGALYGVLTAGFGLLIIDVPDDIVIAEPEEKKNKRVYEFRGANVEWKKMITMPAFYLIFMAFLLSAITGLMLSSNLSMMAQNSTGIDEYTAAWVVSLGSLMVGVGGVLLGAIGDRFGGFNIIALSVLVNAVVLFVCAWIGISQYVVFLIAVLTARFVWGGISTLMPTVTMDAFGERYFGVNYGIVGLQAIIASAIAPQLTVRFSTDVCFIIAAITSMAAAAFTFAAGKSIKKYVQKMNNGKE